MTASPALALGTVQFGLAYGIAGSAKPVAESVVRDVLAQASAAGVTRLDTAAAYGDIEQRLAGLIGDLPFDVVSKIPALPLDLSDDDRIAFVRNSILRSHDRLGSLLSGILFHDGELFTGDTNTALWDCAAQLCGQLGIALGVSGYDPASTASVAGRLPLAMTQLPGSALDQRFARAAGAFKDCEVTLRSIFLQGLLLMPASEAANRLPAAAPALANFEKWCAMHHLSPLGGTIAIARSFPAAYCVVGVDDAAQFEAIAEAWHNAAPMVEPELACNDLTIIDPRVWPKERKS